MWSSCVLANVDCPATFVFAKRLKQVSQQLVDNIRRPTKAIYGCGVEKRRCANGNFLDCQMRFADEMQPKSHLQAHRQRAGHAILYRQGSTSIAQGQYSYWGVENCQGYGNQPSFRVRIIFPDQSYATHQRQCTPASQGSGGGC